MQGVKKYKPKLFTNFYLPDFIPDDNFYKVLKGKIDFNFIYKETKSIYSHTGKPSIDPVVFFKCLLIGYLENLCSDRAIDGCCKCVKSITICRLSMVESSFSAMNWLLRKVRTHPCTNTDCPMGVVANNCLIFVRFAMRIQVMKGRN